jgi:hypothetical protein
MAGTVTASVLKNDTTSPPAFQNSAGTEVGQLVRAWVNFNGTTSPGTIRAAFNVSSVTKNATGDYTVNFTNALADANYSVLGTCEYTLGGGSQDVTVNPGTAPTSSAVRMYVSAGASGAFVTYDSTRVYVAIFR